MVSYLVETFVVSVRRACSVYLAPRSTHKYHSRKDRQDNLRIRLRDLAYSRVSYGYRRLHILLQREGWQVNHKRVYRLYTEEGLTIKRRKPKRHKSVVPRMIRIEPAGINDVWTMDFMSDGLSGGHRFRVFAVLDVYTRECLALEARQRFNGVEAANILTRIVKERNRPEYIHCDNGSEFTSKFMDQWAWLNEIQLAFSTPGKPTENAYIESFNGRVRQECLTLHWFNDLDEVQACLDVWKAEDNLDRPHSSLGYLSPSQYVSLYQEKCKEVKQVKTLEIAI